MEKSNISKLKKEYLFIISSFKEEKVQRYTALVLTFLALCIFGLFAINPTLSTIANLRKQLTDSEFVDEKLQEKITNLGILQNKYNLLKDDLALLVTAIPQTPNAPILTGQLQAMAINNNILLYRIQASDVEVSRTQNKSIFYSFVFSIDGQGSYPNISNFVSSILNFDRIVTIEGLSISKTDKETYLQFNIKGKAYFRN